MQASVTEPALALVPARVGRLLQWLEPLILREQVALPGFQLAHLERPVHSPGQIEFDPVWIEPDSYWGEWCMNFALRTDVTWPDDWDQAELYLPLGNTGDIFSHPECLVYFNGQRLGSADRHHHRLAVTRPNNLVADGRVELLLTGWTGLSGWPHDPSSKTKLYMRACALTRPDYPLERLCQAYRVCLEAAECSTEREGILAAVARSVATLDTLDPLTDGRLSASVPQAYAVLQDQLRQRTSTPEAHLHGIGHAHMDLAYLWTTDQTRAKVGRTFANVLGLMDRYPSFCFTQSQPQLYQWAEENYPDLFAQIKHQVAQGRWELTGGMWVEPDCNIPSGESLVRQILWGRRYFAEHFDAPETPVLFLPDTFGFNAQLPQLMRLSGLKYFMTNKTNWNQTNPLPYQSFEWIGLDGSGVIAQTFTTPRSVQYLPHPTTYKAELSAQEVAGTWGNYAQQTLNQHLPIAYGYGDGGGGPNRPMLERLSLLEQMPGLPALKPSTLAAFFDQIAPLELPKIKGELYLELHRGTYTSQAGIKRQNVQLEQALHRLEWLLAMARQRGYQVDQRALDSVWQRVLLNQFHDILPGTAIAEVFAEAQESYQKAWRTLAELERQVRAWLLPNPGLTLVNDQPFAIRYAQVPVGWLARDPSGQPVGAQSTGTDQLLDVTLPAYSTLTLEQGQSPEAERGCWIEPFDGGYRLGNSRCSWVLTALGHVQDWVLADGWRVIPQGRRANELWAFDDRPICWDAWDIDPYFEEQACLIDTPADIRLLEQGPLEICIQISRHWKASHIIQTIRFRADSDLLEFACEVDWQQANTLLKVNLPTCLAVENARYEIQFGSIQRPAHRRDSLAAARFEVPAQRWGCLSDQGHTAGIVNDCKYGYDANDGVLRLTLVKSSTSPDPMADQGQHRFVYGLVAYIGDWHAMTQQSRQLCAPIQCVEGSGPELTCPLGQMPDNVILDTVKPSESGQGIVVRCYEAEGRETTLDWLPGTKVNLLEETMEYGDKLQPFGIVSSWWE